MREDLNPGTTWSSKDREKKQIYMAQAKGHKKSNACHGVPEKPNYLQRE